MTKRKSSAPAKPAPARKAPSGRPAVQVEPGTAVEARPNAARTRVGSFVEHALRLGIPVAELVDVEDSPAGLIYTVADGSRLVDVPVDRPDAGGKVGLMFLVAPCDPYRGSFPVYEQPLDDDDGSIFAGDLELPGKNPTDDEDDILVDTFWDELGADNIRRALLTKHATELGTTYDELVEEADPDALEALVGDLLDNIDPDELGKMVADIIDAEAAGAPHPDDSDGGTP